MTRLSKAPPGLVVPGVRKAAGRPGPESRMPFAAGPDRGAAAATSAEIDAATGYIARLLHRPLGHEGAAAVRRELAAGMSRKYAGHWHRSAPSTGSAYRCLRSQPGRLDPVLRAALEAAVPDDAAARARAAVTLGSFTLWVDPGDVSMRVGEDGGITAIWEAEPPARPAPEPATPPTPRAERASRTPSPTASPNLSPVARSFVPSPPMPRRAMSSPTPAPAVFPNTAYASFQPPRQQQYRPALYDYGAAAFSMGDYAAWHHPVAVPVV